MKKLIIIGASGHGRVIADIAKTMGYTDIGFLDDNPSIKGCGGYPVYGTTVDIGIFDSDYVIGIGNPKIRRIMHHRILATGKKPVSLIHNNAVIGEDVTIGAGSVIMAGAVLNPGTRIGDECIINTCASVDHDCILEDYVHISVGAHLAGTVVIGEATWIGIGAVVSNNLFICGDCMIGAGAVVVNNIDDSGTYVGVPAKRIK